jgi:hypothetical protein
VHLGAAQQPVGVRCTLRGRPAALLPA